jgi:6-phospho-beta-glucosidase
MLFGDKKNWLKATEWNWQIDPLGFRTIITRYYNDWRLPVFPIENGIGVIESWDGERRWPMITASPIIATISTP